MDLAACRTINDISFCNHNIICRDSDNDCLMALFKQDTKLIGTVCKWTFADKPSVSQLNSTSYAVFSPPSAIIDLRVKCPGQHLENRTTITGLAIIHLPPGCQALCDKFIFTAPNDIPVFTERVTAGQISFNHSLTHLLILRQT